MEGFKEGYEFAKRQADFQYAAALGEDYIENVNHEIDGLIENLESLAKNNMEKQNNILGGDMAEIWHEGAFNINAAIKHSSDHATADRVNTLGSDDIVLDSGNRYGLKYYSTGEGSAKAQAVSAFEEYRHNGGKKSIDEYLQSHLEMTREQAIGAPLYDGQFRLIPDDQIEDAKAFLRRKVLEETSRGDGQVQRYQDALNNLAESQHHAVIDNGNGVKSIPLSKKESTELAQLAKENNIDPAKWGLTTAQLISFQDILKGAFQAGMSAALIDAIFKMAPEIYKAIEYLLKTGEIDKDDLKKIGIAALKGGARGFFIGSVTYSVTTACKAGFFGESVKSINPHIAGVLAVLIFDTVGNAIQVAQGKMTRQQMAETFTREVYLSIFMVAGGTTLNAILGPIGYLIGSLLGSIIGGFTYSVGKQLVISFCVEHGYTAFGLVEQDYTLPDRVLEEIGISPFNPEEFKYDEFEVDTEHPEEFEFEKVKYQTFNISVLRRGVIGVNKVGYLAG